LGLSVCRQLVHSHHGSINIKNRKNGGTEALVLLPFEPYIELVDIDNSVTVPSLT
jgi:K+-sensing histidine kinase KdpD